MSRLNPPAAAALPVGKPAATAGDMPSCFAQISDLHLSSLSGVRLRQLLSKRLLGYLSWRSRRRHEHRPEVLDALRADLHRQTLDQILVTGDLTHIALPAEFQQARDWLLQLGPADQVAVIPGNHDSCVRTNWRESFALWQDYMRADTGAAPGGPVQALFPALRRRGNTAFIGLSSACPTPPFMASGTVGAEQLRRLRTVLDATARAGLFRVVYLHHNPLPGVAPWRKRLTDANPVCAALIEHGVELLVHGHGHRSRLAQLDTRHGPAPVIAVPSASALGLHGGEVAGYNCYRVARQTDSWQLNIETRQYAPARKHFSATDTQHFTLRRPAQPRGATNP